VSTALSSCGVDGCGEHVPPSLTQEMLCLDHFVEQASMRLHAAQSLCQTGQALDRHMLDWLVDGAEFAVQSLSQDGFTISPLQRVKVLELLLGLSNLQEYLRHHSVRVSNPD